MHHEDRAGVNAMIRGLNQLTDESLPVIVIMCTNRVDAIDPAIQRRAAATYQFDRPNLEQRKSVLSSALRGTGLSVQEIGKLAVSTGASKSSDYGFTYSDITQRFLPSLVTEAFPDEAISFALAQRVLASISATKPFSTKSQ